VGELEYREFSIKDVVCPDDVQANIDDLRSRLSEKLFSLPLYLEWIDYSYAGIAWTRGYTDEWILQYKYGQEPAPGFDWEAFAVLMFRDRALRNV
jgi:hypothetical protein